MMKYADLDTRHVYRVDCAQLESLLADHLSRIEPGSRIVSLRMD